MRETNRWTIWNRTSLEKQQQFAKQTVHKPWLIWTILSSDYRKNLNSTRKRQGKTLGCKSSFPSTEKYMIVQTTLWSRQFEQNRHDTAHLQCQSTTKRNKPQRKTLSWTWTGNCLEFCYDSHREPLSSRETSRRCSRKLQYDNRTGVIQPTFILQQTAEDEIDQHLKALGIIQCEFYMDVTVTSISDASTVFTTAKDSLRKCNFNLTKAAATAASFVNRRKTISANQPTSSSVIFFYQKYL